MNNQVVQHSVAPQIRILDDLVINQIAAGEVVERPYSVAKELIENSLDAGATDIKVVVANGGLSSLEVIDNGCGINAAEARLALTRHATSKIQSTSDLAAINTLGFRGEALSSIASVAELRLQTRTAQAPEGIEINLEGGREVAAAQALSLPVGTRIRVNRIFFNTPARKKFLKSERTELAHIKTLVLDYACVYPQVRFTIVADGEEVTHAAPALDFVTRVKDLELAGSDPIYCKETNAKNGYQVEALLSKPLENVPTAQKLRLFVNGRSVRDKLLLSAVRDGYGQYLKPGRYPLGALALTLPTDLVDVNVHPQKSEVRFVDSRSVFLAVSRAIKTALSAVPALESLETSTNFTSRQADLGDFSYPLTTKQRLAEQIPVIFSERSSRSAENFSQPVGDFPSLAACNLSVASDLSSETHDLLPEQILTAEQRSFHAEAINLGTLRFRFIGQIFKCFLLFEGQDEFLVIDAHAAHERIRFVELREQYAAGRMRSQLLLIPEEVAVPDEENPQAIISAITKLGFEADVFGPNTILVRALPAILARSSAREILEDLFESSAWSGMGGVALETGISTRIDQILTRIACHSSVRSGRVLEPSEAHQLLIDITRAESSAFCPHGRPVLKSFSKTDLEAFFGRDYKS
ncbi:DNA mismatch repair endonuclease MutL [bacterium]|nr:DNA mismatch repair endonuclease MutL [bacterium]